MTQTLYNLRNDGDQWRISKFVDGELESSYLCTELECECPAGHRPSCRHRQMLPQMLARKIENSFFFWDFDRHLACDFEGTPKATYDNLAQAIGVEQEPLIPGELAHGEIINPKVTGIPHLGGVYAKDITPVPAGPKAIEPQATPTKSWRRM